MKAFWKSMTIWFNSIMGTAAVVLPDLMLQLPTMQAYLPTDLYRWMFVFTIAGNIVIRFRTNTAVGVKDA